jgi:tetratricopeptide (TPR) repeat protein
MVDLRDQIPRYTGTSALKSAFSRRNLRVFDGASSAVGVCALLAALFLIQPTPVHAEQLELQADQTLFYVMTAINAAGYDEGIDLPDNNPVRKQVRDWLAGQPIKVLPDLKSFYRRHMQQTAVQDLGPYISWAFAVTGAPNFAWKVRDVDVPADAMELDGLQTLMIDFYNQAHLDELWKKVEPAYQYEMSHYGPLIRPLITNVDGYLRATSTDFANRHFRVIVEPMLQPELVETKYFGDYTYVVVSPSAHPLLFDLRHAYLLSLIDPIILTYRDAVKKKASMLDVLGNAPIPDEMKTDFTLICSQSLTKAIEARMDKDINEIDRALHQGYIMTPYFADQLPTFENQPQAMRFYAQTLIDNINLKNETARLANVKFDAAPLQRKAKTVVLPGPELSPAGKTLDEAEALYNDHNPEEAKPLFLKALDEKGEPKEHAQAWYRLGCISILEKHASIAVESFEKALDSSPDDFTRAWSDVYLARLAKESRHDIPLAKKFYQDALAVNGASEKAKEAAQKELNEIPNQEKQ